MRDQDRAVRVFEGEAPVFDTDASVSEGEASVSKGEQVLLGLMLTEPIVPRLAAVDRIRSPVGVQLSPLS